MSSLRFLDSHRAQLVGTAVAAAATTAALISVYTSLSKRSKRRDLDQDILRSISKSSNAAGVDGKHQQNEREREQLLSAPSAGLAYDEDLIREQLARNYAFFGDEAMAKIRGGTVVIVGCGGVGSWAAVMLVRSGVSRIRLIDFDYVTLSSLNRHATAALPDVGTPKVQCVARKLREIARWVDVDARVDIWRKDDGDGGRLLEGADWVVDAIDNIQTKVDLLAYCHEHGLKVFSSMGAGAKTDPTRIQIADISSTIYDPPRAPCARASAAYTVSPLAYLWCTPRRSSASSTTFVSGYCPCSAPLPAIFGLHIATYVLCALADKPIAGPLPIKNRRKVYERMLRDFQGREAKRAGTLVSRIPLDEDDVALLFEDVHRGRSVVPPHANVVVMDAADAERHEGVDGGPAMWGEEVREAVSRRVEEVERWREWVM
ncbi:tRNA threonylcarbamoyladenosine dehydratase [Mycena venus]|uniref:tRNA threonylcarbamoyladenosine dehydratase n=1 Tax=Mycena venus TaxID=2733690 RepID=A0A8H6TZ38_9AGAR|nr:tRNA threonylcarbamoyladenosine dehydratase [Mycena venus]